jgi:hypothetical protein
MRCLNGEQKHKGKQMHLCLAKGSLILTREHNYIPIEEVSEGDHVLTHKGRWRPVLVVRKTGEREAVTVRAQGVPGLTLTPDHKLWCRKSDWVRQSDGAARAEPTWIEAKDILPGYVNQKLPTAIEISAIDDSVWWIVGRWIADGHMEQRGAAMISCAAGEIGEMAEGLGDRMGGSYKTSESCYQVRVLDPDGSIKSILRRCGKGAEGKHFPPESTDLNSDSARALLEGYLSGDGHFMPERRRWMATTVSKKIALGVSLLAQRAYGSIASVYAGRKGGDSTILGRKVKTKDEWIVHFDMPDADRKKGLPFILDDGAWKKARSVENAGVVETWNLRVEEDESYTAEGCIVKNCPMQYDVADRVIKQMSNPGDVVFDPFGGLMTVPYRAIKWGRFGMGVELNPAYFADGAFYCDAAVREQQQPSLFDLLDLEESDEITLEDVA